jgi:hypothetical protein
MHEFGAAVGRYVIMPDHMHLFVCGGDDFKLEQWVSGLKRSISVGLGATKNRPLWQPEFFDHLLRSNESYTKNGNTFVKIRFELDLLTWQRNGLTRVNLS